MMKHRWLVLPLSLLLTVSALASEEKKPAAPDEKAMMEAWMKAATPGEAHKALNPFVGTFDVKVKSWMAPGSEAMESTGTSENRWILEGRFVEQRFAGTFMGAPFNGMGYTGYDNITKKYIGMWIDNMSTAAMLSTGSREGNAWSFTSTMTDPLTGKAAEIKEKITVVDNDHHTMEMWGPAPDGKMFKSMEISYTRKK